MNDKVYQESSYVANTYARPSCEKQFSDSSQHQYYLYTNMQVNNVYSQSVNLVENYNNTSQENGSKGDCCSSQMNLYPDQMDISNWESRIADAEKILKLPEKFDMIEITSKDLSPASCCSNLDIFGTEFCRKDAVNYCNNWGNCTNQKIDLPSCAQVSQTMQVEKTVKYCSIQKTHDDYVSNDFAYSDQYFYKNKTNDAFHDTNLYPQNQQYFQDYPNYPLIDQQTDFSNEESDIVVEESDEEIIDFERLSFQISKCIICNVSYSPMGNQFYFLTLNSPLTMSSQKPVYHKIVEIIGGCARNKYLCGECLGLINTIDHLQLKLNGFRSEMLTKFRKTCQQNSQRSLVVKKLISVDKLPKYKCKYCRKILSMKQYCRLHVKRHKIRGFLCEICGKISSNRKRFKVHLRSHQPKVPKIVSFKCSNCPKSFRTKSNLKEHKNYCLGILPFVCKHDLCEKKFASASKLKNHIKFKHEKKFIAICSICNIGFIKVSDYKSHMITHSTEKKFACSKCDKCYKTLSNLNFHMKIHNDKLPFNCDICNKGFMRKEYLDAHLNNHNGVKNFSCTLCGKKFVSQKNLDAHLKYHDGSTKAKTCNICGKTMITGFEEHLRIHNNLREFECDQCDLKFNTKGTLAKHKKRKHVN